MSRMPARGAAWRRAAAATGAHATAAVATDRARNARLPYLVFMVQQSIVWPFTVNCWQLTAARLPAR
jgi:hypothetical protein